LIEALQQISILIGIWVAIYGIDSWRREHVGKRQMELAEETLALFYEAEDAINHIRHPASFGAETEHVERGDQETDAQFQARKNASVVFRRYNEYQELFNKIHAMRYRFMAQFGKTEAEPFDELRNIVNEIILSARMLSRLWPREHFRTDNQWEKHRAEVEKYEAVFWGSTSNEDAVTTKVKSAISKIETTCKNIISERNTLHGILKTKIW
jgi:hypothetical protein